VRLSRMAPRPAIFLVAIALAISAGWALLVPRRVAVAGVRVHTIGSHFAHVPQALTPRSNTDERKDLRNFSPSATPVAAGPSIAWHPHAAAVPAIPAGRHKLTGSLQYKRGPPSFFDV
jgi:hypothetical protein